jgi:hypothetical protein
MGDLASDKSSKSSTSNTSTSVSTVQDERLAASDNATAIRLALDQLSSGGDLTVNYAPTNVDQGLVDLLAGGAAAMLEANSKTAAAILASNSKTTDAAIGGFKDLKASELSGGSTDWQKTGLIALGIGAGAFVLLKVMK